MTDERIHDLPSGSTERIQRFLLLGRLAEVMEKMVDAHLENPDTETHKILSDVTKAPKPDGRDSRLTPNNLGPVLEAMKRRGPRQD